MSYQIELYVPLSYNDGSPIPGDVRVPELQKLIERFGGCTVLPNANGYWLTPEHKVQGEPVQIWRVIAGHWDSAWWDSHKKHLCEVFRQEEFLIVISDAWRV